MSIIKIILSSHAHWDHVEGHARMKKVTGAKVMAIGKDAEAISSGIDNSAIGAAGWEPTPVDRVLEDGDQLRAWASAAGDLEMTVGILQIS